VVLRTSIVIKVKGLKVVYSSL